MVDATSAAAPILNAPIQPIAWIKTLELSYAESAPPQSALCFHCGKLQQQLLKCGKCKVAGYCQKECQVADWKKNHKLACASYARVGPNMTIQTEKDMQDARNEIFGHMRFYVCPYAVHKQSALGRGFLFIQSDQTLAVMSIAHPMDSSGRPTGMRSIMVHYLTLGEYDHEVCRDDFEMAAVRTELQRAVANYDEETKVVMLTRFRCGHVALGTATLVPEYNVCKQLGRDYFAATDAGALQLNIDDV
jgi:MYND finger